MRVAVVDIGTNSTRLLVADVARSRQITELDRRSTVTRLGQGVDTSGRLADEAMERVFAALAEYRAVIDELGAEATTGVLTSAVRDAANGAEFQAEIRRRFDLDVETISGDREAELTFLGATDDRDWSNSGPTAVIDIGGGSTEFVVGEAGRMRFHVSTQVGVVRMTERHLHHDPPHHDELEATAADVRAVFADQLPADVRDGGVDWAIAVAGTATSAAAILLELEPYDADRVHGHVVYRAEVEMLLARLAEMTEAERRELPGLHPDRAPTIVAGMLVLAEAMRALGLDRAEVSEHDILRGAALVRAGAA